MWAVTRSIKFQNKLAKEAIINALKSRSKEMFQDGDMLIRAFTNVTENSIEIFHLFKNKEYVNKQRSAWTNQFWQDIREMGGNVSFTEGECEVEYSPYINLEDFKKIEYIRFFWHVICNCLYEGNSFFKISTIILNKVNNKAIPNLFLDYFPNKW